MNDNVNYDPDDFISVYLKEIKNQTGNQSSSFNGQRGMQSLDCILIDLFMGGSETTSITLIWYI